MSRGIVHRNGAKIINGVLQNINPATGELLQPSVAMTTSTELSTILSKAKIAQQIWGNFPLSKRIALLRQGITSGIQPIAQQLATTITSEMGKILSESKLEVQAVIQMKGKWLDVIQEANEDVVLIEEDNNDKNEEEAAKSVIVRDPLGVVAVLSPWNVSIPFFSTAFIHVCGFASYSK